MKENCWNNRPKTSHGYWVKTRQYRPDGTYEMEDLYILNVMSKNCGQPGKDLQPLPGCVGCEELGGRGE